MHNPIPSSDDTENLIISCRYGDADDVKSFVDHFGIAPINEARDENGNTVLHMACANGHIELLQFLLSIVPSSLLSAQNRAGSTALHWAALNAQLAAARALVEFPGGPGVDLIDVKNAAGRSPLGEAEAALWDEGAKWMVGVMRLDDASGDDGEDAAASPAGEEVVEEALARDTGGRDQAVGMPPSAIEKPVRSPSS